MSQTQLECVRFVVDETPYACWEWDLRKRNLRFLEGIDPKYFTYVAEANVDQFDGENKHRAALALRIAYSQALETLFALLCAMVQAPECVIAWLLAYRNAELDSLVSKLTGRQQVYSRLKVPPTWDNLSIMVHQFLSYDAAKRDWVSTGFAEAWGRFAHEFLDAKAASEYNGIKHGLRARLGGFSISAGLEDTPGQPAPVEAMKRLGGSPYGTSFYTVEKLGEGRTNFRVRENARNWTLENLISGIYLLSMSIGNVIGCLRIINGEAPENCSFVNPNSPEVFNTPWEYSPSVTDCSFDLMLTESQIVPCSKQEILNSYQNAVQPEESTAWPSTGNS